MAFDYKKEYKQFYMPARQPMIINIPSFNFIAVEGQGDPNEENGEYQAALELLYGLAYTIKMSKKSDYKIEGYFDYVVPPLEGLWWQNDGKVDYSHKEGFQWISMIRLPDFVSQKDFEWAKEQATKKKKKDFSKVQFMTYNEGLCIQCMHIGSYDDEPKTIEEMETYVKKEGYKIDINDQRLHHEIYLSDPRKTDITKLKTVIRHPISKGDFHV